MEPEERARAGTVFAVGGALMVLATVLGTFLLLSGGPGEQRASTIAQGLDERAADEAAEVTRQAPAAPASEKRRCWDGSEVEGAQVCRVDVEDAQFWAFGLDRSQCRAGRASSHARWSYECPVRGVDVHVATYSSLAHRNERLATYGAQRDTGGGRVLTGGPDTDAGRWLRTYDASWAGKGLLMYASVDGGNPRDMQVLVSLQQRFPDKILQGEPVVAD